MNKYAKETKMPHEVKKKVIITSMKIILNLIISYISSFITMSAVVNCLIALKKSWGIVIIEKDNINHNF